MNKIHLLIAIIISLIIGIVVGYFVSAKTVARFNAINATCTTLNVAVENKMLSTEQVRELGRLTHAKLGDSQTTQLFQINKEQMQVASPDSNCSQYMVGMSE